MYSKLCTGSALKSINTALHKMYSWPFTPCNSCIASNYHNMYKWWNKTCPKGLQPSILTCAQATHQEMEKCKYQTIKSCKSFAFMCSFIEKHFVIVKHQRKVAFEFLDSRTVLEMQTATNSMAAEHAISSWSFALFKQRCSVVAIEMCKLWYAQICAIYSRIFFPPNYRKFCLVWGELWGHTYGVCNNNGTATKKCDYSHDAIKYRVNYVIWSTYEHVEKKYT